MTEPPIEPGRHLDPEEFAREMARRLAETQPKGRRRPRRRRRRESLNAAGAPLFGRLLTWTAIVAVCFGAGIGIAALVVWLTGSLPGGTADETTTTVSVTFPGQSSTTTVDTITTTSTTGETTTTVFDTTSTTGDTTTTTLTGTTLPGQTTTTTRPPTTTSTTSGPGTTAPTTTTTLPTTTTTLPTTTTTLPTTTTTIPQPTISITWPQGSGPYEPGQHVITFTCSGPPPYAVTVCVVHVDGAVQGFPSPYTYAFDPGPHQLRFYAENSAGRSREVIVNITVSDP